MHYTRSKTATTKQQNYGAGSNLHVAMSVERTHSPQELVVVAKIDKHLAVVPHGSHQYGEGAT